MQTTQMLVGSRVPRDPPDAEPAR